MRSILTPIRHRLFYIVKHLKEKRRGVDFTLPDRMYDRHRNDGAMYYPSSDCVLRAAFSFTGTEKYDRFFDVGCGKGYVLRAAADYGYRRVGGVEYDRRLAEICAGNMRRVGLDRRVRVTCGNAASFRHYGDYNFFYFFNPFKADTMEDVIAAICRQCRGQDIQILYYHPRFPEPIERTGYFRRVRTFYDRERDYEVYVYRGRVGTRCA